MNFIILQAQPIPGANRLLDYGVLGILAFILLSGYVYAMLLIKKKYEAHLAEKDKMILEQKEEIRKCREEMKRVADALDHANDVISENSKALYENASVVHRMEGILIGMADRLTKK